MTAVIKSDPILCGVAIGTLTSRSLAESWLREGVGTEPGSSPTLAWLMVVKVQMRGAASPCGAKRSGSGLRSLPDYWVSALI